mgnify:CR=1 FL=1
MTRRCGGRAGSPGVSVSSGAADQAYLYESVPLTPRLLASQSDRIPADDWWCAA